MQAIIGEIMKKIDEESSINVSSYDLMEQAGSKMAEIIFKKYNPKNVLLVLGSGANAGDALVVGRYLLEKNINVDAYIINTIKNENSIKNLNKFKGKIVKKIDDNYDLIIDGIFGIGLNRDLNDDYVSIINKINNLNIKIVSLDIPSGIDSTTGISYKAFIKSDLCISVKYHKTGLFLNDGLDSYSNLELVDLDIHDTNDLINIIELNDFKNIFPKRLRNTNKGTYGKASIIASSINYPGASKISYNALSAFKMGVGFANLFVPKSVYNIYAISNPEIIVNELDEIDGHIKFNKDNLNLIIRRSDSISIGMGMTISYDLYQSIDYLLKNYDKRLLIDADGLNTISKYGIDILKNKKCDVILTPHLKEFERLTNISLDEIKKDIFNIAKKFAKEYNVILILKSSSTIITDGNDISIQINGNTALAKAGSGDSLSGIASGLLAYLKNENIYNISKLASFILGMSADLLKKKKEEECITITEIINNFDQVFKLIKEL